MPDKYQEQALKTWFSDRVEMRDHLIHVALGLASEAGEFAGLIDKNLYKDSRRVIRTELLDELGDVFYNVCIAAHLLGVTIDELAKLNA